MSETKVDKDRALAEAEHELIRLAREKAFVLYEGKQVAHRSCGIVLAETFNLPAAPYQALRRGGITGEGECGAIKAGELVLGEILGDPNPTGPVTPELREAALLYRELWSARVDRGEGGRDGSIICNKLTAPLGDFFGETRHCFCTNIAAEVAAIVAEVLLRSGRSLDVRPVPEVKSTGPEVNSQMKKIDP